MINFDDCPRAAGPVDELYDMEVDIVHSQNGHRTESLQGGFILFKPSMVHYHGILEVMRKATARPPPGDSKMGCK